MKLSAFARTRLFTFEILTTEPKRGLARRAIARHFPRSFDAIRRDEKARQQQNFLWSDSV